MEFLIVSNRKDTDNATYFQSPERLEQFLNNGFSESPLTAILFVFWAWKVPDWMLGKYHCYGAHTGFLLDGKGKGGSPIDNLQRLGITWAALNVFKMTRKFDEGSVRLAIPLDISGTKDEVCSDINDCIPYIVDFLSQDISNVPERFKRVH
jgi:hypothetical protein